MNLFLTVFVTIFLAELGDKTQLATLVFAADKNVSKVTVFVGAALALIFSSGLGVTIGGIIAQYGGEKYLSFAAGCAFIAIGLWTLLNT